MRFISPNVWLYFFLLGLGVGGFFVAAIWPGQQGLYAFMVFAGAGGFGAASYIYYVKKIGHRLVCPVGSDCNAVINSSYAKFLGIGLECWGMAYYGLIVASYTILLAAPQGITAFMFSALTLLTTAAFFFSLYLLIVQAFILRQWCIWCLLSAMVSITIFIASLAGNEITLLAIAKMTLIIEVIRTLGFALGIGGATAVAILFVKFLKDFNISISEKQILTALSELVWLGLILTIMSQFIFFVGDIEVRAGSAVFIVQTIALIIAAASGAALMIIIAPILALIPFKEEQGKPGSPLSVMKQPLFILGAVGLAAWYFALAAEQLPISNLYILGGGLGVVLAMAVSMAWIWGKRF